VDHSVVLSVDVSPSLSKPKTLFPSFLSCRKKYEIATDEEYTPIKQDEKKGKLREVGW